jgi:hypothetical protein
VGTHFTNNTAHSDPNTHVDEYGDLHYGEGGAVTAYDTRRFDMHQSLVVGNTATDFGGGVCVVYSSSVAVVDIDFRDNACKDGGAMLLWGNTVATITSTSFVRNTCIFGCGISAQDQYGDGMLQIDDGLFKGNVAGGGEDADGAGDGGGLNVMGLNAVGLYNTSFTQNEAAHFGGAVVIAGVVGQSSGGIAIIVDGATFQGNAAQFAGGAFFAQIVRSLDIRTTVFRSNVVDHAWTGASAISLQYAHPDTTSRRMGGALDVRREE